MSRLALTERDLLSETTPMNTSKRRDRLRPRSGLHPRPRVEGLEARQLLTVAGTLDPTYGALGYNTIPVITPAPPSLANEAFEAAVTVGPGGQADVVGTVTQSSGTTLTTQTYLTVTQIRPDGTRDLSFGYNGQATVLSQGFTPVSAFVLPSGKILVVGETFATSVSAQQPMQTFGSVRFNADGSLDTTYGSGGFALNPLVNADGTPLTSASISQAALQPDGKVVLAGLANPTGSGNYGPLLVRINADGTPDTTFGAGGEVIVPPVTLSTFSPTDTALFGLAIQPGGGIVLAGSTPVGFEPGPGSFHPYMLGAFAIRLTANGTQDGTFGGASASGVVALPYAVNGAVVALPDGRLLVAGSTLTRLNADGTPDTTFGPGGVSPYRLQLVVSQARVEPDGKIALLGTDVEPNGSGQPGPVAVMQLNADGTPDPTFGDTATPGLAIETTPGINFVGSVVIEPDGNILLAATRTASPDPILSFYTARILTAGTPSPTDPSQTAGTLDPTYGRGGLASTPVADGTLIPQSAGYIPISAGVTASAIGPDGKLVVVGSAVDTTSTGQFTPNTSFATIAKFNLDGSLDTSFGGGGRDYFPGYSAATAVAVQPDGSILVAMTPAVAAGATPKPAVVYRLLATGIIDYQFHFEDTGNYGFAPIPGLTSSPFVPDALAVQPDGGILVGGTEVGPGGATDFAIARLDPEGRYDSTFGGPAGPNSTGEGFELIPFTVNATTYDLFGGLALQPDGRILLAGSAANGVTILAPPTAQADPQFDAVAVRLNPDGSLDTTFGGATAAGRVILPNSQSSATFAVGPDGRSTTAVALQPSGPILILAGATHVFRLNPTGVVDTGFGTDGSIFTAPSVALLVQPDGQFLTVGDLNPSVTGLYKGIPSLSRFTINGTPDATFGEPSTPGISTLPLPDFGVVTATLEFDGNILLAGDVADPAAGTTPGINDFAVARVLGQASHITPPTLSPLPPPPPLYPRPVSPPPVSPPPVSPPPVSPPPVSPPPVSPPAVTPVLRQPPADFDGSGRTNLAVYLPSIGAFVSRPTNGGADVVNLFGIPGAGQTIPALGDYDGVGRTEIAAYLPSVGVYAIRPADGGPDRIIPFGIAGAGETIPVPGDYQGTGRDNIAVYLPAIGSYLIRPIGGGTDQIIPFGIAGAGQSIPAPGDYFGTGQTDLAVYLPSIGAFAIRNPSGGPDVILPFGIAGSGQTIPVPGDYDGSGKTELAVYMPALGVFAYRPANGGADVLTRFGAVGDGVIPAPGDYTGSGHTEIGVYDPTFGVLAYRPANGGADVLTPFGTPGPGQSLPLSAPEAAYFPATLPSPPSTQIALSLTADSKTVTHASVATPAIQVSARSVPQGPSALNVNHSPSRPVAQTNPTKKPG